MDMEIRFDFNLTKAIEVMAFFAHHIPGVEKVKITKLIYLADKEHFLKFGWPITGDRQYAMLHGPVPSECLNALDGEYGLDPEVAFKFIHVDDNRILLKQDPGTNNLEHSEVSILREIIRLHGRKNRWALRDELHLLPEYKEVYREGTSTLIPYELMLKHSGDPKHFRMNRPVISRETRLRMACPFPA